MCVCVCVGGGGGVCVCEEVERIINMPISTEGSDH